MRNPTIYDSTSKPAGILRIVFGVTLLIAVLSAWGQTSLNEWAYSIYPFLLWVIPATLNWLALMLITKFVLKLFPRLVATAVFHRPLYFLIYHLWPVLLGGLCAGYFAGLGANFHNFQSTKVYLWNWPAAFCGVMVTLIIVEWFNLNSKRGDPANNQAKLLELQARIQPHFLFNTLNSAIALVRLDPDAAEETLQNLAVLFRAALESGDNSTTTVSEEVDLAKRYLSIEEIRLGERLQVEWEIDEITLNMPLPKLTLQPLVENAIRHGIEPMSASGRIMIKFSYRLGKVELDVANTMPPPKKEGEANLNNTKGHGMALANLRERIALLYDFEGALKTSSLQKGQQHWFNASLKIPATN